MKILLAIVACFVISGEPYWSLMFGLFVYIVKELAAAHRENKRI